MEEKLIEVLERFGYPAFRQGTFPEEREYPESFFTFFNNESMEVYYDNKEQSVIYDYDVNFYSNDPETINIVLEKTIEECRKTGFVVTGRHDVMSDEVTHTGKGISVKIREEKQYEDKRI